MAAHWTDFASAKVVFEPVATQMRRMAYGSAQTMVDESLVRAAVILYFESHASTPTQMRDRIIREQSNGFVWMPELCELLRKYESDRTRYPNFDSFIPRVGQFYAALAPRINQVIADFGKRCVHVTGLKPFANHSGDVDPSLKQITVVFDRPLVPGHFSMNYGAGGKDHFPVSGRPQFLPGDKAIVLPVVLKPDWRYSLMLTGLSFASPDGYPLENYEVSFKTR